MTISEHDQRVIDDLEHAFGRSPHRRVVSRNGRWLVIGFAAGLALILLGLRLDDTVGVVPAVVGFAAITACLGDVANLLARPWLGGHGHLTFRRWSSF